MPSQTEPPTGANSIYMVDGVIDDVISVNNRGLAYGDGLFETIKVTNSSPDFFELHVQRLKFGCKKLGINLDEFALRNEVTEILESSENNPSILKIIVTRGESSRGYSYNKDINSSRILILSSPVLDYKTQQRHGISARLCELPMAINPSLAGLKHLNRLENVIARAEWDDPSIAEGFLLDTNGHLVEGTMSNIFVVEKGGIYTPDLSFCGVEGIVRGIIINDIAKELKLPVYIQSMSCEMIKTADEIFICNSLIGIWPVTAIGDTIVAIGPITRLIQDSFSGREKLYK